METNTAKPLDVLIAGAGPVGLMMGCLLALHHISFRIIDKKTSVPVYSGALIVHARTMEVFHQLGIAEKALEAGIIARGIHIRFNHKKNYFLNMSAFGKSLTRFPYLLMIEQGQTVSLLSQFLKDQGHWVERDRSLMGFTQENNRVTSQISKPDGSIELVKSRFLIGADGHESVVRKQLNIPFPGKTQASRLFITDCKARLPISSKEIFFFFSNDVTSGFFPLKGNLWRIDGLIPVIQQEKAGFEEVRNFFSKKLSSEIHLSKPRWFSVFRSHSRCATLFRHKQCFLMGDAAHVHSPVGAQGMNTGLQDAHNLAWKLAFVIHELADEKLLDTYQAERRPLALNIIRYTDWVYSFMTSHSVLSRFTRLQLFPRVLPLVLSLLSKSPHLCSRIFSSVSGIGIRYKKSNLTASFPHGDFPDHSPKPGERLPYFTYEQRGKKVSLDDGLVPTTFYLFVFGKHLLPASFQTVVQEYKNVLSLKHIEDDSVTQSLFKLFGIKEAGCYLVRPDLYIAWRCQGFDEKGLSNYLKQALK
ncbi:MAG: FAD-dependent monooxygenase [Verrucomicrobia bacterium]|nr:FAD-dependent monooxygenase [Prolixibacteraceae bacterium]